MIVIHQHCYCSHMPSSSKEHESAATPFTATTRITNSTSDENFFFKFNGHYSSFADDLSSGRIVVRKRPRRVDCFGRTNLVGIFLIIAILGPGGAAVPPDWNSDYDGGTEVSDNMKDMNYNLLITTTTMKTTATEAEQRQQPEEKWPEPQQRTLRFLAEGEPCRPEWHRHQRNNATSKTIQAMADTRIVEQAEEPSEICAPALKCALMASTDGEESDSEAGSETYRCVGGAKVAKKRKWQRIYRNWREKCTAVMSSVAECHAIRQPPPMTICPSDSRLVLPTHPTPADCCKATKTSEENTTKAALKQRFCQCDFAECERQSAATRPCTHGTRRYMVSGGGGTMNRPGSCCDQFECRAPEPHCVNVECLDSSQTYDIYASGGETSLGADHDGGSGTVSSVEMSDNNALFCPVDSFRPVAYVPKGACCPIIPSCRCRAGICRPARCTEPKTRLVITRRGENRPGRCCDEFKCVADDASTNAEVVSADRSATHCRDERDEGGHVYADGERWHLDSCETCACHGGVALCRRMQCPMLPPDCGWVGVPDGECCPICLGCRDDAGQRHAADDIWSRDDCTTCTCGEDFRWHCQKSICKTDCDNPRHVSGQCCPVCDEPLVVELPVVCASVAMCSLRCEHGLLRNKWGCFECECAAAPATDEHSSVDINAEEFTGAAAMEVIPERHDASESISLDLGRDIADVMNEVGACEPLTSFNCNKQCAHGFRRSSRTHCPICRCASCPLPATQRCYKHCLYGYATNSHGCRLCKCRPRDAIVDDSVINNDHRSRSAGDDESNKTTVIHRANIVAQQKPSESVKPRLSPAYGHHRSHHSHYGIGREPDDGCYATSVSGLQLIRRDSGEWWTDDHCRQCFCQHRTIFCSIVLCASRPAGGCSNGAEWFRRKGECCPSCVTTSVYSANDTDDRSLVSTTTATAPMWRAVCYGPGDGRLFVDGETWRVGGGGGRGSSCVACTCRMGHVLCAAAECAALACAHPVPDPSNECCMKCLPEPVENSSVEIRQHAEPVDMISFCLDDVTGLSHAVGTAWRVDECRACRCDADGQTRCFTQTCDNAAVVYDCAGRQLLIKGHCCPICSYVLNTNNRRHYDGGVSQQLDTPPLLADRLATFPQNVVLLTALGIFASIVLLLCAFLLFIGWRCVRNASTEKFATLDDGELAAVSRAIGGKLSIGSAMAVAAPFSASRHCSSGSAVPQNFLIVGGGGDTPPATPSRKSRNVATAPSASGLPLRANSSLYAPKRRMRGQPRVSIGAHSVAEDSSVHYDDGDEEVHVLAVPEIHTGQPDAEQRRRLLPSSADTSSGGGSGYSNRLSTASSSPSTRDRFHSHHPAAMVAAASTTMLGGSTTTMTTTVSGSANGTVENLSTLGPADFTARSASNAADAMRPGAVAAGNEAEGITPGALSAPVPMRCRTTTSAAAL